MRKMAFGIGGLILCFVLSGCVSFSTFEQPRVDQKVSGNKGVVDGVQPPAGGKEAVPTRTIIKMDVQLPDMPNFKEIRLKPKTVDKEITGNEGSFVGGHVEGDSEFIKKPKIWPKSGRGSFRREKAAPGTRSVKDASGESKKSAPTSKEGRVWPSSRSPQAGIKSEVESELSRLVQTYKVGEGESLSDIAARPEVYDDAKKWPRIYEANRDVLKGTPNRIYPGQVLRIPRE